MSRYAPFAFRNENTGSLYGAIYQNSLLNGLQLCLDAADSNSWYGGTQWRDLSSNSIPYNPASSLPTFHGSIGGTSSNEYFSFNGSNFWTCSAGNPSFIQAIHKPNAVFSFLVAVNFPSWQQDGNNIFGDFINGVNQPLGFRYEFGHNSSGFLDFLVGQQQSTGNGYVFSKTAGSSLSLNAWHIIGLSMNISGATGFFYKDGSLDTASFSATYLSPTSSNDPNNFAVGGGVNGAKMAFASIWNVALTKANFDALFGVLRTRFGI